LKHPNIEVHYTTTFSSSTEVSSYDHAIFTGPLDEWFAHAFGRLPYRTLEFENFVVDGDYQGCAVMNFCDASVPFTRVTEHKHFAPWRNFEKSILSREFSREAGPDDEAYYPVRLAEEQPILRAYEKAANETKGVSFVGRLATFRYIDMDVAIDQALSAADRLLKAHAEHSPIPVFFHNR
jgi:UDP-galactopyranose mutase